MPFVDSHAHLDFPDFDPDRGEVIARAKEAGVGLIFNVGTDPARAAKAVEIAETYEGIYAIAGLHPQSAKEVTPHVLKRLEGLMSHPRVIAIGEVGLDFYHEESPREKQIEVLREFIHMQKRTGKPLVVHCRDAYEALEEILLEEAVPPFDGIMHCFSSDKTVMKRFLDLGFHISFAGALTYKKNDVLREACRACPLDRIFFETDSPFLAPQSLRGKRNEPAYVLETYAMAAGLHGISREALGEQTLLNAKALFRL
jgi:TatD DNase family protein